MSLFGSLTNWLTGGANGQAEQALNEAMAQYNNVDVPDAEQLTLPELQQYVQAGLLTPDQAQAALQKGNAYDDINLDPRAREASMDALSKLQEIGDAGGHDAQSDAAVAGTQSKMNQTLAGQRASIMDQMDQRGIPSSLMGVAAQLAAAGQDSEQAHSDALQANADASTRALQALEASGTLGSQIEGQQSSEASQKAAAQNAIDQWNAANQTTVNLNNTAASNSAKSYNAQTAQSVGNANTQNANARTSYNANIPQQIYNDQLTLANAKAAVNEKQAGQYTGVGQQNAGTAGAMINLMAPQPFTGQSAGSTAAGSGGSSGGGGGAGAAAGAGSAFSGMGGGGAAGGAGAAEGAVMLAAHGGQVPGTPTVPGDSPLNDKVPAVLSPGEVVIPRSEAHTPQTAAAFIKHMHRHSALRPSTPAIHPEAIKGVLHALSAIHGGR